MTVVLLFAMFLAGTITGLALMHVMTFGLWRPPPGPPGLLGPRMIEELALTSEQREKAREIRDRGRPELEAILRETYPRVRVVEDRMENELRQVLTPEQRTKLDTLKARRPPQGPPRLGGPDQWNPPPPPPPWEGPPPGAPPAPSH